MKKTVQIISLIFILFLICSCGQKPPYELQKQTEHFSVYCLQDDLAEAEKYLNNMESTYNNITREYGITSEPNLDFIIHPDQESFNENAGNINQKISGDKNVINLLSSRNNNETVPENIINLNLQAIVSYLIFQNEGNAPNYLLYAASQYSTNIPFDAKSIFTAIDNDTLPTIAQLKEMDETTLTENQSFLYVIADYVVSEYDKNTLGKLVRKPNTKSILSLTEDELFSEVIEHFKKTYVDLPFDMQKETDHFLFYCQEEDVALIDDIVNALEDNYERVTTDLLAEPSEKCKIVLYPDSEWLEKKCLSYNNIKGKVLGFFTNDIIALQSPSILTADSKNIPSTAVHEFVHAVTKAAIGNSDFSKIPRYLIEGIASYEADKNDYQFTYAADAIKNNTFPEIEHLEQMNESLNPEVYIYGSLFCEYVFAKYGSEKMVELLKNYGIENVLGISKAQLKIDWIDYIKTEYNIKL